MDTRVSFKLKDRVKLIRERFMHDCNYDFTDIYIINHIETHESVDGFIVIYHLRGEKSWSSIEVSGNDVLEKVITRSNNIIVGDRVYFGAGIYDREGVVLSVVTHFAKYYVVGTDDGYVVVIDNDGLYKKT